MAQTETHTSALETVGLFAFLSLAGLSLILWVCAWVAVELFGHGAIHPNLIAPLSALLAHRGDPALAWPVTERADIPSWGAYWGTTVVLVAAFIAAGMAVSTWWLKRKKGKVSEQKKITDDDIARFIRKTFSLNATIQRATRLRGFRPTTRRDAGIFLGTHDVGGDVFASFEDSLLVVGPPRSGKSSSFIIPTLLDAPGPVVTTSTRPDVINETIEMVQRQGRPVYIFDPQNLARGAYPTLRWSPVFGCAQLEVAHRRASAFSAGVPLSGRDDAFWQAQAVAVLAPYLMAADVADLDISSVQAWAMTADISEALSILTGRAEAGILLQQLVGVDKFAPPTRASVFSTVQRALDCFVLPSVSQACSPPRGKEFDPRKFLEEKGVLYVLGTPQETSSIAPLLATILDEIVAEAHELAWVSSDSHRLEPPLELLLDEAANIAPLPNLAQLMATGGGSGIVTAIVLQSESQAVHRWGAAQAKALEDSATWKVYLPGLSDIQTLSALSTLGGSIEVEQTSETASAGGKSTSTHTAQVARHTQEIIRALAPFHAYLLPSQGLGFIVSLRPYWYRRS